MLLVKNFGLNVKSLLSEITLKYGTLNELPKLLIIGDPGRLMKGQLIEFCRKFKNQTEVTVKGNHFLQEESPKEIAEAINNWIKAI